MDIAASLLDQISKGRVVLVLGVGATQGATRNDGTPPPTTAELTQVSSKRFLGGEHAESPLDVVGELAIAATDLREVQEFIATQFDGLKPARFHSLLTTFRWRGFATTNYDMLIETVYGGQKDRVQDLVPFRSNSDRVDDLLRSGRSLQFLKLHGCISRVNDENTPLILTPDQYVTHRRNRDRLFNTLLEWAHEHPLIFVGHSMHDADIRQLLLEVSSLPSSRPRYYMIKPTSTAAEIALWGLKRITILKGSFEDFLTALDTQLPSILRGVITTAPSSHPIESRFVVRAAMSEATRGFVTVDSDYIHAGGIIDPASPQQFYRGFSQGWSAIDQELDVRRTLVDTILGDVLLVEESEHPTQMDFYFIWGEAGAGKSVVMRRIAWEAGIVLDKLCIFLQPGSRLRYEPIREIWELAQERIFLFVDNAADHVGELEYVLSRSRREGLRLTVITAERLNEWNMGCERLEGFVSRGYPLQYLTNPEIGRLVDLLEKHKSLGYLQASSREERIRAFEELAGRQLLVALHEATRGRSFEDILVDEYREIQPLQGQILYLTVCVLNRLRVPVRAGLISRIHGIPFTQFAEELFKPLEHVVAAVQDKVTQDFLYTARHPLIAQIVFDRILTSADDRFNEYIRIIGSLNPSFKTDHDALHKLIRGRMIEELFQDYQMADTIFRKGKEVAPDDPYLLHQEAIYEMRRPSANFQKSSDLLNRAKQMAPTDVSIVHSFAELELQRADRARMPVEREFHRRQAKKLANSIRDDPVTGSFAFHTLLKAAIADLRDLLVSGTPSDSVLETSIREIEGYLEIGLQKYPQDQYLLTSEADFGDLIKDNSRALDALTKAFRSNPRSGFIANRLAKAYLVRGQEDLAASVIQEALEANPGEKQLQFSWAKILMKKDPKNTDLILNHLLKSFSQGDQNHEARFWCAVYLFRAREPERRARSKELFLELRSLPMSRDVRNRTRHVLTDDSDQPVLFRGRIAKQEASYGFIEPEGSSDWIYFSRDLVGDRQWPSLTQGSLVVFHVGFNYAGPTAMNISPVD